MGKYLARAGGGICFIINDNLTSRTAQLFHLNTTIKLTQLLRRIKERTNRDPDEKESQSLEWGLLGDSVLDWRGLGRADWTEKKKASEKFMQELMEQLDHKMEERAILKLTREEHAKQMVAMESARAGDYDRACDTEADSNGVREADGSN